MKVIYGNGNDAFNDFLYGTAMEIPKTNDVTYVFNFNNEYAICETISKFQRFCIIVFDEVKGKYKIAKTVPMFADAIQSYYKQFTKHRIVYLIDLY